MYGGIEIGWVFRKRTFPKSIPLFGDSLGRSQTTRSYSGVGVLVLECLTRTTLKILPLKIIFLRL